MHLTVPEKNEFVFGVLAEKLFCLDKVGLFAFEIQELMTAGRVSSFKPKTCTLDEDDFASANS